MRKICATLTPLSALGSVQTLAPSPLTSPAKVAFLMTDLRDNQPSVSAPQAAAARGDIDHPEIKHHDASTVPCVYCMAAIPSGTFVYWTHATRLLSADCPQCTRRTTLAVRGLGPLPLPGVRGISVTERVTTDDEADPPLASICACGHAVEWHDTIARRYCDATQAGILARGCICLRTHKPGS
jgi:hypothetical protein